MKDHRINARIPGQRPEDARVIAEHEEKLNRHARAVLPVVLASLEELVNGPNAKQNACWDRARAALKAAKP